MNHHSIETREHPCWKSRVISRKGWKCWGFMRAPARRAQ